MFHLRSKTCFLNSTPVCIFLGLIFKQEVGMVNSLAFYLWEQYWKLFRHWLASCSIKKSCSVSWFAIGGPDTHRKDWQNWTITDILNVLGRVISIKKYCLLLKLIQWINHTTHFQSVFLPYIMNFFCLVELSLYTLLLCNFYQTWCMRKTVNGAGMS